MAALLSLAMATSAAAQFKEPDADGAKVGETLVQRWRTGMTVTAVGGPCKGIVGTAPMPVSWPEQDVRVVEEEISPSAKMTTRMVEGSVKEMVVSIPLLQSGEEARVLVTLEITRRTQVPPTDTDRFVLADPKKLEREVRPYLAPSPMIESKSTKIIALAKEIGADKKTAWSRVEAIYDWVREHVKQESCALKGALAALKYGTGDREDITSLFIAICRAGDIPARTVWVHGHCYPEFYLLDEKGKGHWFPCQSVGDRQFGGINETRAILEKGDNFKNPQNPNERQRYRAESLTGAGGRPRVRFVRDLLPN